MCMLGVAINSHPYFSFICVHNRDEMMRRPTEDPTLEDEIICGRDLKAGGTWMGLNRNTGSFVTMTNFRNKLFPGPTGVKTSRGTLLTRFLTTPPRICHRQALDLGDDYTGFNMLYSNLHSTGMSSPAVYLISNRPHAAVGIGARDVGHSRACVLALPNGVHGFSNGQMNDNSWKKVKEMREGLVEAMGLIPDPRPNSSADRVMPGAWGGGGEGGEVSMKEAEAAAWRAVEELTPVMTNPKMCPVEDVSYSTYSAPVENALQSVFIPSDRPETAALLGDGQPEHRHKEDSGEGTDAPLKVYGTRTQSFVLRAVDGKVFYFYRSTDDYPHVGPWLLFSCPPPVVGDGEEGGAEDGSDDCDVISRQRKRVRMLLAGLTVGLAVVFAIRSSRGSSRRL